MRDIHVSSITDAVKKLCMEANWNLEPDMLRAFDRALTTERSPAGKQVLQILKDHPEISHLLIEGHTNSRGGRTSASPFSRCRRWLGYSRETQSRRLGGWSRCATCATGRHSEVLDG